MSKYKEKLTQLKESGRAPEFLTEEGYTTLTNGYLLPNEEPIDLYRRVSKSAASYYKDSGKWEEKFFSAIWKNWLCIASPIASNLGSTRGLPISCLVGETWLNTRTGGVQIQDVNVGDELLTHEGRYKKVLSKQSRMSTGDLFKIKIGTRLTPTEITGNHPLLTNLGWVRVDELDPKKHFIATNSDIEHIEQEFTINMKKYIKYDYLIRDGLICKASTNKRKSKRDKLGGIVGYYCKVPEFIKLDEKLAWTLGLWCAEGSRTIGGAKAPNGARITMGRDEEPIVQEWLDRMKHYFNVNGSVNYGEATRENFAKGKTCRWLSGNVNGGPVGEFFVNEFGTNCKTKKLPQWLIDLPKSYLTAFIAGLCAGDGSIVEHIRATDTWSVTLANPWLLLGLYNICLKLGMAVSLQMQAKPSNIGTTKYVYVLRNLVEDSVKLSKFNARTGIKVGKVRYCPILELDKMDYNKEVFDVTVADDHSFSAAGFIVHNCNSIHLGDSINSIFEKVHELAILSKNGAGCGLYFGDVRGRGADIHGNGKSEGIISWAKCVDSTVLAVSQGGVRRSAAAAYLPIDHPDIYEFLEMRKTTGDANRRCPNLNHGVCISDEWMEDMLKGNKEKRFLWQKILVQRVESGEPYIFFTNNVNRQNPECYKANGLDVKTSNICCLSGDTLVLTEYGSARIDSLIDKEVKIWDGNQWVENNTFEQRGSDNLIRIHLEDGTHVDSNKNHRWFVWDNDEDGCEFITQYTTNLLQVGDHLDCHQQNGSSRLIMEIVGIEELEGTHPVYCPHLPSTGKFALANGLMTGNTEIFLHTDPDHSFVCCLSSLNLTKWDEWKDTDLVETTVRFLDAVLEEYIQKSNGVRGLEASRRSAIAGRAIGIGILGYHSLLQQKMIPFDSFEAMQLNNEIFRTMRQKADAETAKMAVELGEPEWCKGHGRRHTHCLAVAPTVSNSLISGGHSAGIEPLVANIYAQKSAKGTFIRKNPTLEKLLQQKNKDTLEIWSSINANNGSVQHLDFLDENEKAVFLTAREINQHAIIKQAAQRQKYIDQGQSVNLFFASNADPKYIHEVHLAAWEQGLKSLYYFRSEGVLRGDLASRGKEECAACEA